MKVEGKVEAKVKVKVKVKVATNKKEASSPPVSTYSSS